MEAARYGFRALGLEVNVRAESVVEKQSMILDV